MIDRDEAAAIAQELQRWHNEARSLFEDAQNKPRLSCANIEALKSRLAILKADIKDAAKYETLSRRRQEKTDLEQSFFGPCVRSTSANFRMRADTNPLSGAWSRGLQEVEFEVSYALHNLECFLKESS